MTGPVSAGMGEVERGQTAGPKPPLVERQHPILVPLLEVEVVPGVIDEGVGVLEGGVSLTAFDKSSLT